MLWNNELTRLLKVQYPIVQAPMLGVTSPEMVAAVSNAGGLGSLPVGGLSPEKTRELIHKVKQLTHKPFAVNLFAHSIPEYNIQEAEAMRALLKQLKQEHGLATEIPELDSLKFYTYEEQIPILIDESVPVVSFTFGIPDDASLQQLKQHGTILIGTATCVDEAIVLEQKGVHAITLQGIEAGGHRGSFLHDALPQIGLMALVPMAAKVVKIPLIASGAINSGATVKAAFTLGAVGVQIGTAFIASTESLAIPAYKEALATAQDTDTALTQVFSGRWARGIHNAFMEQLENSGSTLPPYPVLNSLTGALRAEAQKQNNGTFTNLWAGQAASMYVRQKNSAEILMDIIKNTEQ
jgi:nitronate monooxygenase